MFQRTKSNPSIIPSSSFKRCKKSKALQIPTANQRRQRNVHHPNHRHSSPASPSSPSSPSSSSSYIIQAYFKRNILTIIVFDSCFGHEWRQQFTQNSFKTSIRYVAKILINAIKQTANQRLKTNDDEKDNNDFKEFKIFQYNNLLYVTLLGSNLPSFALRPVDHHQISISEDITLNEPPSLNRYTANNTMQNISKLQTKCVDSCNESKHNEKNNQCNIEPFQLRPNTIKKRNLYRSYSNTIPLESNANSNVNDSNNPQATETSMFNETNDTNYNHCNHYRNNIMDPLPKQHIQPSKWKSPANFNGYSCYNQYNHGNYGNNGHGSHYDEHISRKQSYDTLYSNTTITSSAKSNHNAVDKGPGFSDNHTIDNEGDAPQAFGDRFIGGNYHQRHHKHKPSKDNIKYGFV